MRILYIGDDHAGSTSNHRFNALRRLGHEVTVENPLQSVPSKIKTKLWNAVNFRTGYRLLQPYVSQWIKKTVKTVEKPDFIWIDSGELLGKSSIKALKSLGSPIILYNVDDPTGKRDGHRFDLLVKSLLLYDLIVVVRKESEFECRALGAKNVLKVNRSYDEVAHAPFEDINTIPSEFRSEVAFIGTWMRKEKRDEFMLRLIDEGVPLSIWGDSWHKSKYFPRLKQYLKGPGLIGRDYTAAIQGSKICLGLLSAGNRDLHTQRSFEVPFAGGLFCAQRTSEHIDLYQENVEAVFWADADECAKVCKDLLANDSKRESIRTNGMQKVRSMHAGNEDLGRIIIHEVEKLVKSKEDLSIQSSVIF
jgi:spore maturation protein CgeB